MTARDFAPRFVDGLPARDYHALPSLSSSGVKKLLRSPAHYLHERTRENAPTDAMRIGTAVHTLVLEPERAGEVVAMPEFNMRTNAGKAAAIEWLEAHPNRQAFDAATYDRIQRAADAVRAHPGAARLLTEGTAERSVFWRDQAEGIDCRARFDWHREDGGIVDLKTAKDASPAGFSRAIGAYGYHISAAHYCQGAEHVFGAFPRFWGFVVVEPEPPFAVACYVLDEASIRAGMALCARAYRAFRQCVDSGAWPAYPSTIEPISAPRWALRTEP
jgi:hypothetical protein